MSTPVTLIGQTLSHYRITERIGAGGMGEVYRATDTSLGRDVAIKVLPPEVAGDAERLARFKREAHLLACLNHPHIAAIYGLEEADGRPFLTLELVEGEDLKQRLDRGAIPVDEVLEIALQVAEALEEAHSKGIVHRDLKPANVKITKDGKVKVLDFGLAKAWAGESEGSGVSSSALSHSPTLARTGTVAGVILGTAAYMSPEQARGKGVDKRADVWSFGVLLWEMLTGRALFAGETVSDVLASVLKTDPEVNVLPPMTPPAVRRLIGRCLRKDPRQRLPDIGAARLELQETIAGTNAEPEVPGISADGARRTRHERWAWAAALLLALAVAAGIAFVHLTEAPPRQRMVSFAADTPDGWPYHDLGFPVPSPDGTQIVFVARPAGAAAATLWTRPLGVPQPRPLPGTEGGDEGVPFWSPDSRSIGFFAGGELRRLDLADGAVRRICVISSPGHFGSDWNREGTILFSAGVDRGQIYRVSASGGEPKPVTTVDPSRSDGGDYMPQFLPDGRRFLFAVYSAKPEYTGIYVASLDAPAERRRILSDWGRYVYSSGHLLFVRDGTLFAWRFDPTRVEPSGDPVAVASSVASSSFSTIGQFGVSEGTLAYATGVGPGGQVQFTWLDRKGERRGTVGGPGPYNEFTLSPDEKYVAFDTLDSRTKQIDLWLMDVNRGVSSRVTATPENENNPVWAPDGLSLAYSVAPPTWDGKIQIRRKGLRASDAESVLVDPADRAYPESWSRDGKTILFLRHSTADVKTAWALPLGGEPFEAVRVAARRIDEPQVSPDGRWVAYMSDESGRYEVYIEPFRRNGPPVRVSTDGGGQPKWRGDGRELFYATPGGRLMAVGVHATGDRLEVGLPTELFTITGMYPSGEYDEYAPSGDGQRFLVKLPVQEQAKMSLQVVTGWRSLLGAPAR